MIKRLALLILLSCLETHADSKVVLSMVPRGKITEQTGRDFIIKTQAGSKVWIEFKRSGKFEEARGLNLNQGDYLEPGDGLITLSSAAQALASEGLTPRGAWSLDYDEKYGWVYEIAAKLVDAKSGKIISEKLHQDYPAVISAD